MVIPEAAKRQPENRPEPEGFREYLMNLEEILSTASFFMKITGLSYRLLVRNAPRRQFFDLLLRLASQMIGNVACQQ
jgi:hypothetical protein